ncbi:MAG TPA: helix-turn-helix transcriptional regulator [Gaiellaceae bacterium]|nr:helix-turn-helix transcriptional regulator [Gaiellaceae bacterium]
MARDARPQLDLLLLATLERGPAHGYRAIELLRERSGRYFAYPEGTVYPALHRLERDGLVSSRWSTGAGRRRRTYRLTRKGSSLLARERREWALLARAVEAVLAA